MLGYYQQTLSQVMPRRASGSDGYIAHTSATMNTNGGDCVV